LVIQERPSSTLRNVDDGLREVPELEIRERPPSTLRNIDGVPPRGAGARDPGAPTINAKKHRRWTRVVSKLEIQKRPLSTLRNIDGGPLKGARAEDPGAQRMRSPPLRAGQWMVVEA
jgi:hypothetical protein